MKSPIENAQAAAYLTDAAALPNLTDAQADEVATLIRQAFRGAQGSPWSGFGQVGVRYQANANIGSVEGREPRFSPLTSVVTEVGDEKPIAPILPKKEPKAPPSATPGQFEEERLLNRRMLRRLVPVSDMTLWRWEKAGLFPRHLSIYSRNFWLLSEVMRWIANHAHQPGSTSDTK